MRAPKVGMFLSRKYDEMALFRCCTSELRYCRCLITSTQEEIDAKAQQETGLRTRVHPVSELRVCSLRILGNLALRSTSAKNLFAERQLDLEYHPLKSPEAFQ